MAQNPNKLDNGEFSRNMDNWAAAGGAVHAPGEGNDHLGAASLPAGGATLSQNFNLGQARQYTISYAAKAAAAGSLLVEIVMDGGVVWSETETLATSWEVFSHVQGLAWGEHTIRFSYVDQAAHVDDVWISWVPATRQELANMIHARLGTLATGASMTTGSYEAHIDSGLRAIGATWRGVADHRTLNEDTIDAALDQIELAALNYLHRHYSTKTDFDLGPRSEKLSQISGAIERLIGVAVGGRPAAAARGVVQRRLWHGR